MQTMEIPSEGMTKLFDGSDDLGVKNICSGVSKEVLP